MGEAGRVAIVTGGGSGIGSAVAIALAEEGFSVVVAGRRQDALDATLQQVAVTSERMLAVPTDVRDPASVQALFARTNDAFGRLDVLFNNAGVGAPPVPLEELTFNG